MARVTIEGCLKNPNISHKFELVVLAYCRARCLESGEGSKLLEDNYQEKKVLKSTIIALKEIETNCIDINEIKDIAKKHLLNPDNANIKQKITEKPDNSENDFFIA